MSSSGLSLENSLCLVFPDISCQSYEQLGSVFSLCSQIDHVLLILLERSFQKQMLSTKERIASSISCGMFLNLQFPAFYQWAGEECKTTAAVERLVPSVTCPNLFFYLLCKETLAEFISILTCSHCFSSVLSTHSCKTTAHHTDAS